MFCVFLYGPFCHGANELDLSKLFTTFFLSISLPFILIEKFKVSVSDKDRQFYKCISKHFIYVWLILKVRFFTYREWEIPIDLIGDFLLMRSIGYPVQVFL